MREINTARDHRKTRACTYTIAETILPLLIKTKCSRSKDEARRSSYFTIFNDERVFAADHRDKDVHSIAVIAYRFTRDIITTVTNKYSREGND